jgi:hypothetical protein
MFCNRSESHFQSLKTIPGSKRFSERALSYPLSDSPNRRIKSGSFREQILKLKYPDRATNSVATTLEDLKRDMRSTIKTLSLLFLYLFMYDFFVDLFLQ